MADLKVTIKESINLNNTSYGSTRTATYKDITDVYKRTLTLTADVIINLYTTVAAKTQGSVLDKDSIKYVRISNLESSESINVKLTQGSAGVTWLQVAAGDSLILGTHSESMDAVATGGLLLADLDLGDITQVDASANTAETTARIEIFVASVINAA
jgi:hypothetical protein